MATNTTATATTHTGNGSTNNFAISFSFLANNEVDVTVAGVLKTLDTHYTISGSTVTFTSGNTPANGAAIKFQRDTNISTKKVDFQDGSVLTETDLDTNSDQVLFAQQEITDKLSGIEEGATADQTNAEIRAAVEAASDSNVFTDADHTKLNNIEDNATADQTISEIKSLIAGSPLDASHLAANSVDSSELVDGSVDTSHLSADCVTNAKIADNAIDTPKIADGQVDAVKLNQNSGTEAVVTNAIRNNAVTTAKIADGNVTTAKLATDAVVTSKITDGNITTAKIANSAVTTAKLGADCVTEDKIADDAVREEHLADNAVTTTRIVNNAINSSKIADDAVTTGKIADAELKTLAGMQSATASKLADSTALTSDIADLNQLDGMAKQTTITDDDTKFPTSGAVVDYVAAQLAPIGGLEVIATDAAFPNTQPASGVVISIADAGGLVVDANGTSTTARTVGGSTVTINNFASNFNSSTVDAGVAIMVSSTGTGQVYNYHKATLKEADLLSLSNDINDFAARYRVTTGEPTSNNDEGDLIYDKNADKMKVFDSTTNAFKEVTSVGDFKFLFLCPTGGSGSPTIDGSIATYDLREGSTSGAAASITSAAQLIVSINGVIQKPNTGTSAPSEGFAMVDSNTIIFGSNLPTGAEIFIIQIGSATTLNVPADNSVATAKIQNQGVTTAKIADANITTAKIADDAVTQAKIAANAVDTTELAVGAVTHDQLADNTVDADHLQSNAVTSPKIFDSAVSESKLGSSVVSTTKIADNAVTSAKIADDAVGADQLASNAVVTASIVDDAITQAKINIPLSNRNLIINGAMLVAQRALSKSHINGGYQTVDRFKYVYSNNSAELTQQQANVSSGTTPYTLGFRRSYKLTNGNQSGTPTNARIRLEVNIEAQDIANSGWNYTDSNSYVTLSFWVNSSVSMNFFGAIRTPDGTSQGYSFETGTLSANTWTKITKTIPGNSNLTFDNNNELGWSMLISMYHGTNTTTSGHTLNQWAAYNSSSRIPDQASTWYTTDNATWEITGLQLEVGSVATKFEHKSFDEVRRQCYRYFQKVRGGIGVAGSSSQVNGVLFYRPMRTDPSVSKHGTSSYQFGDMVDQGRSTSNSPSFFRNDGLFGHSSYMLAGFSGMTTGESMRDEGAGGDAAFELSAEI